VSEGASTIEKNPTKRVGIIQSGPLDAPGVKSLSAMHPVQGNI
jgi:hypothetical protein